MTTMPINRGHSRLACHVQCISVL